jgi:hypothetical protein
VGEILEHALNSSSGFLQIHYLEKPCSDYVRAAVQAAADIHQEDMPGDILIFLTGVFPPLH